MQLNETEKSRVRLDLFSTSGFDRGRGLFVEMLWYFVKCFFFLSAIPWPSGFKGFLLRLFGASVGEKVVIKPRVNIHLPWKLTIGDHSWIGEEVNILNFEPVVIGAHCCISQRVFLCTGNHDYREPSMPYRNGPIDVLDGAWIGAQAFVAPNVVVGEDAIVSAASVVVKSLEAGMVYAGNPCLLVRKRWKDF